MDVAEIHEGEERPLRLAALGEPAEELAIDDRRRLANSRVEHPDQVGKEEQGRALPQELMDRAEPFHGPVDQRRRLESAQLGKDEIR